MNIHDFLILSCLPLRAPLTALVAIATNSHTYTGTHSATHTHALTWYFCTASKGKVLLRPIVPVSNQLASFDRFVNYIYIKLSNVMFWLQSFMLIQNTHDFYREACRGLLPNRARLSTRRGKKL